MHTFYFTFTFTPFFSYYLYFYSATFLQYVLFLVTFYEHSFAKMLPTQNYGLRCCLKV